MAAPEGIFVSIASYCDPVLPFTLQRAAACARHPGRLHFGVVDQVADAAVPRPVAPPGCRLSQLRLEACDARGPCFARALAMSLHGGEPWFLQIDSHMDFAPGWDEALVAQARALGAPRRGLVLSSYPAAFEFVQGEPVPHGPGGGVLVHVVKPGADFAPDHPVLPFQAQPVPGTQPLAGFHLAAGCLFAPASFVEAFPYDPWLYFHGEEQALALRLFTHGWDIFHVPGLPLRHLYNDARYGAPPRPLHWDAAHEAGRETAWWKLEQRSRQRLAALVAGEPLGAYGLGSRRSLADYAAFSGIDYPARHLAPRAFRPAD